MQNTIYHRCIRALLILMVMVVVGCTKEDESKCNPPHSLEIRAVVNVNGEIQEVGSDVVKGGVVFYVFDQNEGFLEMKRVELGSQIALYYPFEDKLHLVCWGNSESEGLIMPTLEVGTKLEEALISINTDNLESRSVQQNVTASVDDLFHARDELTISDNVNKEIIIERQVASVSIISTGLKEYCNTDSEDFRYVFRSGKKSIDFTGLTKDENVSHTPAVAFKDGLLESSVFNIFPDPNIDIEVDIYLESALVATISTNVDGKQIRAEAGKLLNIYAVFKSGNIESGDIDVNIQITPWGEKAIWKEF